MRDAPRKKDAYRGEEYIGSGVEPAALDALARAQTRGRYSICAVLPLTEVGGAGERDLRTAYQSMALPPANDRGADGARPGRTVLDHRRTRSNHRASRHDGGRSSGMLAKVTRASADSARTPAFRRATRKPPQRQYVAWNGNAPVGWVASIVVGEYAWCSNMYVAPTHRRRGIARALLQHMLAGDRAAGARANVLLANHAGAKLYPRRRLPADRDAVRVYAKAVAIRLIVSDIIGGENNHARKQISRAHQGSCLCDQGKSD